MSKKEPKTKRRGLPKGRTNNPDGRPVTIGGDRRLSIFLPDATYRAIERAAEKLEISKAEYVRRCIEESL